VAAAAIVGIFGTIAGLIAADQYRHEQDYAYGPVYSSGYPTPVYGAPVLMAGAAIIGTTTTIVRV